MGMDCPHFADKAQRCNGLPKFTQKGGNEARSESWILSPAHLGVPFWIWRCL